MTTQKSALLLPWLLLLCLTAAAVATTAAAESARRAQLVEKLGKNVHAMQLVQVQPVSPAELKRVRVLCWVNTYHKNHKKRVRSIKNTWGKKCDKILFMSDIEDPALPTVRIVAPPLHETLWQKHREIVRLIAREFREHDFDWVFKCDDDTFLLVENLKRYLLSPEIQAIPATKPTLLGHRMTLQWWEMERSFHPFEDHDPEQMAHFAKVKAETKEHGGLYYTPGGGGYAMNWAYLKKLEQSFDEPYCLPTEVVPDDWAISFCMRHHGVFPHDTRDAEQRERFHQYDPNDLFFKPHDETAFDHNVFSSIYQENNWFSDHFGIGWQNGEQCCAPDSISFHYVKPPLMELFYEFYYGQGDEAAA
ncbi:Glycoprotein-n-acetylgalactosamine 3-beta-galactosyltransferase [Globisporangium polare]